MVSFYGNRMIGKRRLALHPCREERAVRQKFPMNQKAPREKVSANTVQAS